MGKKPKPSQSITPSEDDHIEIEPHLEEVDIKSIKAEPEPSGSGSGGPGGSHAAMVEADLGDESYGASGAGDDDNGDFGAEGEFEGLISMEKEMNLTTLWVLLVALVPQQMAKDFSLV